MLVNIFYQLFWIFLYVNNETTKNTFLVVNQKIKGQRIDKLISPSYHSESKIYHIKINKWDVAVKISIAIVYYIKIYFQSLNSTLVFVWVFNKK